ncbi:MAG: SpaA isopeptide-forming pilin-related protein [Dysgonomonas sp.]
MKKLLFFIPLLGILFACQKDDLDVTLINSGSLTISVKDNNNNPIKDAKIRIYRNNYLFIEEKTNQTGIVDFGDLLQDTYSYTVSAVKNGFAYSDSKTFQIIAGKKKTIESNPFANTGTITIRILKYDYWENSRVPYSNLNVTINSNTYYPSLEEIISKAYFSGKTDGQGTVTFKDIPANYSFRIYLYENNKLVEPYDNYPNFSLETGEDIEKILEVWYY